MRQHSTMMALYLVVIALGAVMTQRHPWLGFAQIALGALFFGLRLHIILKQRAR